MAEYTDIVARFTDEVAAETLASFITSIGVPCEVVDIWDPVRAERFAIRVERNRIDDLRQALELKPVATRLAAPAAQILAGRLAREKVPCYVGGLHIPGPLGDFDVPIKETTESGLVGNQCMVAVPARFTKAALRIVNLAGSEGAKIDEEELAKLALREPPPDDYVPSTTTSVKGDSQARRMAVMMPIFSGVLFLVSASIFVIALASLNRKIDVVIMSGLMSFLMLGAFLGSLRGGKQDK